MRTINVLSIAFYMDYFLMKLKHIHNEFYHYKKLENKYPNLLNFNNIPFPVKADDIEKFCEQNENISVNVFHYDEDQIYPLVLTPRG